MATFSGDVQYSQNGTVTNPCIKWSTPREVHETDLAPAAPAILPVLSSGGASVLKEIGCRWDSIRANFMVVIIDSTFTLINISYYILILVIIMIIQIFSTFSLYLCVTQKWFQHAGPVCSATSMAYMSFSCKDELFLAAQRSQRKEYVDLSQR